MTRAAQLRALLRNDEALLEHYNAWAADMEPGDLVPVALHHRVRATIARFKENALELSLITDAACSQPGAGRPASAVAGHSSPAAPASPKTLAGSLVTNGAAQPG